MSQYAPMGRSLGSLFRGLAQMLNEASTTGGEDTKGRTRGTSSPMELVSGCMRAI